MYFIFIKPGLRFHSSSPSDKQDYCFHAIVKCIAFLLMGIKAFNILQLHAYRIEAEQSYFLTDICVHFGEGQLCQSLVTLVDLKILCVPWGQSRWKSKKNLEHLIKKACEDPYLQQIQQIFGQFICSVCCCLLACPSFKRYKRAHLSSLCSLLHGLKYD